VLALSAGLSVLVGMIAVADRMYLSERDLGVGVSVAIVSGAVSLALMVTLGLVVMRNSRRLSAAARRIGDGEPAGLTGQQASAELRALAAELVATDAKLTESRENEQRIERSRRELLAWISHDLRTPLAGIMSLSEALEDSMAADPSRYHRRIRELAGQLSIMVDDLFELSKIDSGTLQLRREAVSLVDVVSDAVADLRALAPERQVLLVAPSGGVPVMADPHELSRAITNLLVNAAQHTPAGSPITVIADVTDGRPSVSVVDSGTGISEADLSRVFDAGWRGSDARTPVGRSSTSGAGLGLAIVRGILEAHAGEVRVRNLAAGCRFDLVLPREATVVAA
jgi:signal transduction histidine kinase